VRCGFTLIELMIVVALIAVAAGVVSLALRDPAGARLATEAARLSALLEGARAQSRASGLPVYWVPQGRDTGEQFRFEGLDALGPGGAGRGASTRWLDAGVSAEVLGAKAVVLGPEPLIGAQRIVLHLADQRIEVATDGLGPFKVDDEAATP
jgi:general secretion pathway protein H